MVYAVRANHLEGDFDAVVFVRCSNRYRHLTFEDFPQRQQRGLTGRGDAGGVDLDFDGDHVAVGATGRFDALRGSGARRPGRPTRRNRLYRLGRAGHVRDQPASAPTGGEHPGTSRDVTTTVGAGRRVPVGARGDLAGRSRARRSRATTTRGRSRCRRRDRSRRGRSTVCRRCGAVRR